MLMGLVQEHMCMGLTHDHMLEGLAHEHILIGKAHEHVLMGHDMYVPQLAMYRNQDGWVYPDILI